MTGVGTFLVVDDNPLILRGLGRLLGPYGTCHFAGSAADAEEELAGRRSWDGFVFDVELGDGCGLEVLEKARKRHRTTPAVVLSGLLDREIVNRANLLGARFVCKPCGVGELAPFVGEVVQRASGDRVHAQCERARHRWDLSTRETEILRASLQGQSRAEYVRTSGISINTFKTHVRKLLEKADYENLASLAIDLLRE